MERSPSGYLPRYPHFDQVFGKTSTLSEPLRALDLDVSRAAAEVQPGDRLAPASRHQTVPRAAHHTEPGKFACPALHLTENDYICRVKQIVILS